MILLPESGIKLLLWQKSMQSGILLSFVQILIQLNNHFYTKAHPILKKDELNLLINENPGFALRSFSEGGLSPGSKVSNVKILPGMCFVKS